MPQVKGALDEGLDFNVVMALNDRAAIGGLLLVKIKVLIRKFQSMAWMDHQISKLSGYD